MPTALNTRELFSTWSGTLSLSPTSPYYGKEFDKTKPFKYWYDNYLYNNPTFIGCANITSPSGRIVQVSYLKGFVEYPYAVQQVDGKFIVDRLIMLRDEAMMLNIPRGDEGGAFTGLTSPTFSISDIIWDRPLADDEVITRVGPMAIPMIITDVELKSNYEISDVMIAIENLSKKIDLLLAK